MPTPEFISQLRSKIGHESLWLSSVTAVVTRGEHLLMVRRADNGAWTPVTGIIDPGEEPAAAAEREVLEEAGVVATAERLAWVHTLPPMTWPNGDRAQFLDLVFRCRWNSGRPYPADGENTEAAWFGSGDLGRVTGEFRERIAAALDGRELTKFER